MGRKVEALKKGGDRDLETGRGESQELTIGKTIDRASVDLMLAAMRDRSDSGPPPQIAVKIDFVTSLAYELTDEKVRDEDVHAYLKIRLGKALLKQWSIDGSGDERPTESLTISFNQSAATYYASADGGKTIQTFGPKGWDQQSSAEYRGFEWASKG